MSARPKAPMTSPDHSQYGKMKKSEQVVALVLDHLLASGFMLSEIKSDSIEMDADLAPFLPGCLMWLISERLIHCEIGSVVRDNDVNLINPMISSLGLAVMNQRINIGDGEQTMGEIVSRVGKGDRSFSQFGDFFGGLIGGFMKSLGG